MKRRNALIFTTVLTFVIFVAGNLYAQSGQQNQNQNQIKTKVQVQDYNQYQNRLHHRHFIDLNNDGYNDNAPDADGDGIPNGQDPDYVRPLNGKGSMFMYNGDASKKIYRYGSGICDGTGPKGFKRSGR